MTIALLLSSIALVLATVAGVAVLVSRPARRGPSLVGETIVLHTRHPDDRSIRGVVSAQYADRVVLRDATLLIAQDVQHPIPHVTEVPWPAVSWWQRIEARE
jgi:hypothetical protein